MPVRIRAVQYFHTMVKDEPGEAYRVLVQLAGAKVNLLAFSVVPLGPEMTQLTLFPESVEQLARVTEQTPLVLTGPQNALLIQGDDRLGALVDLHRKLYDVKVNVYASSGVADGIGGYGYVLYVRAEDFESASHALGI